MILSARLELLRFGLIIEAQELLSVIDIDEDGFNEDDKAEEDDMEEMDEIDEKKYQEKKEKKDKKNKKDKKSKKGDGGITKDDDVKKELEKQKRLSMLKNLLEETVEKMKEKASVGSREEQAPTRHVETLKHLYMKTFLNRLPGKKSSSVCSRCKGGWHKIVLYNSRIVYSLKGDTVSTAVGYASPSIISIQ